MNKLIVPHLVQFYPTHPIYQFFYFMLWLRLYNVKPSSLGDLSEFACDESLMSYMDLSSFKVQNFWYLTAFLTHKKTSSLGDLTEFACNKSLVSYMDLSSFKVQNFWYLTAFLTHKKTSSLGDLSEFACDESLMSYMDLSSFKVQNFWYLTAFLTQKNRLRFVVHFKLCFVFFFYY